MVALFTDTQPPSPSPPRHASRTLIGSLHHETSTPCQDVHITTTSPTTVPTTLFAILDGHGPHGEQLATLASATLQTSITSRLTKHLPDAATIPTRHAAILRAAFAKTADVIDNHPAATTSGTTATVALLHANSLTIANLGDSAVVLARSDPTTSSHAASVLTVDHSVSNPDESRRVVAAGGLIDFGYVCDADPPAKMISVTRAFGDLDVRPIGVLSVPDVRGYEVRAGDFLILATDGLWDAHGGVEPQVAVDAVRECCAAGEVEEAADVLMALAKGRCRFPFDDATLVVVAPMMPE